jgi:hypothetical protein
MDFDFLDDEEEFIGIVEDEELTDADIGVLLGEYIQQSKIVFCISVMLAVAMIAVLYNWLNYEPKNQGNGFKAFLVVLVSGPVCIMSIATAVTSVGEIIAFSRRLKGLEPIQPEYNGEVKVGRFQSLTERAQADLEAWS